MKEVLIIKSEKYPKGTVLKENYIPTVNGIISENGEFINKKDFIYLTEKLSREDEARVRELIKDALKLFLWRLYTRQSFLTQ